LCNYLGLMKNSNRYPVVAAFLFTSLVASALAAQQPDSSVLTSELPRGNYVLWVIAADYSGNDAQKGRVVLITARQLGCHDSVAE
jgi:hypothetical protein